MNEVMNEDDVSGSVSMINMDLTEQQLCGNKSDWVQHDVACQAKVVGTSVLYVLLRLGTSSNDLSLKFSGSKRDSFIAYFQASQVRCWPLTPASMKHNLVTGKMCHGMALPGSRAAKLGHIVVLDPNISL